MRNKIVEIITIKVYIKGITFFFQAENVLKNTGSLV